MRSLWQNGFRVGGCVLFVALCLEVVWLRLWFRVLGLLGFEVLLLGVRVLLAGPRNQSPARTVDKWSRFWLPLLLRLRS